MVLSLIRGNLFKLSRTMYGKKLFSIPIHKFSTSAIRLKVDGYKSCNPPFPEPCPEPPPRTEPYPWVMYDRPLAFTIRFFLILYLPFVATYLVVLLQMYKSSL